MLKKALFLVVHLLIGSKTYFVSRWRFVIHRGIDGFSTMIVFLQCSTNNIASTVLELFEDAVQKYDLPSRVRSDKGGENTKAAWPRQR